MTPYELRFEIFKQARGLAESQYAASFEIVQHHNSNESKKWDYPVFPSYESIEALANKINDFVSTK